MPRISKAKLRHTLINNLLSDIPENDIQLQTDQPKSIYLSMDIATKSLAYCIVKLPVNISTTYFDLKTRYEALESQLQTIKNSLNTIEVTQVEELSEKIDQLSKESKEFITVIDGSVDNLIPDKKDKDISEVERIKALVGYFHNKLNPSINSHGLGPENMVILLEHQMAPNTKARAIACALITVFADYEVHIVKPILKNRINISKDDHWINFVKQYKTLYTANKKHAIHNFELLSKQFKCCLTFKKTEISHVSDAFMQVLGYIKFKK
jgi:FtsZ-binding cell division protein ZapB